MTYAGQLWGDYLLLVKKMEPFATLFCVYLLTLGCVFDFNLVDIFLYVSHSFLEKLHTFENSYVCCCSAEFFASVTDTAEYKGTEFCALIVCCI